MTMDRGDHTTMTGSSPVVSRIQGELDPDAPVVEDEDLEDDDWDDIEELDELDELEFDDDDWDDDEDEDLEEEQLGYVADDDDDMGVGR